MIDVHDVTFAYPNQELLFKNFHWQVTKGETWALLGPSGCGKSTLLTLLAGLIPPNKGEIWIDGKYLTRPRPRTGLILQDYGLLPWATVEENIALGLKIRRLYGPDGQHAPLNTHPDHQASHSTYWLKRLGLEALAKKYPRQLSGGQRQRTAIARTLILEPDLLLMDEPFASLDAPTRESLQELTLTLCAEKKLTILMVTHAIEEAAFMGQKILLMDAYPVQKAHIIDNPHLADTAYRRSPAYQSTCTLLRANMERTRDNEPKF